VKDVKINKYQTHYKCVCPEGYMGNGVQCIQNGTLLHNDNDRVELSLEIKIEDGKVDSLLTEMGNIVAGCAAQDCQATFNQTEIEY